MGSTKIETLIAEVTTTRKARAEAREAVATARRARQDRQAGGLMVAYETADKDFRRASRALDAALKGKPWVRTTKGGGSIELWWAEGLGHWVTIPKD